MFTIWPICALNDNYIWHINLPNQTILIDPGDLDTLSDAFIENVTTLWITHRHADHIGAVPDLIKRNPNLSVMGPKDIDGVNEPVADGDVIELDEHARVTVWHTPGHTREHVVYFFEAGDRGHLFSGDTLFSAGCGRVFDGSIEELMHSLDRINTLPENTLIYPAHEYTMDNLAFANTVEPYNRAIAEAQLQSAQTPTLPVTLAHERRVNPFLRFRSDSVRNTVIATCNLSPNPSDLAVFSALRQWKNHF